jgi:predicted amidophosphoribosyltransferase
LGQLYRLNHEVLSPAPRAIGIFADVLTTGAHFKAVQAVLRQQFSGTRIVGFFIARRVAEAGDPDEMDLV